MSLVLGFLKKILFFVLVFLGVSSAIFTFTGVNDPTGQLDFSDYFLGYDNEGTINGNGHNEDFWIDGDVDFEKIKHLDHFDEIQEFKEEQIYVIGFYSKDQSASKEVFQYFKSIYESDDFTMYLSYDTEGELKDSLITSAPSILIYQGPELIRNRISGTNDVKEVLLELLTSGDGDNFDSIDKNNGKNDDEKNDNDGDEDIDGDKEKEEEGNDEEDPEGIDESEDSEEDGSDEEDPEGIDESEDSEEDGSDEEDPEDIDESEDSEEDGSDEEDPEGIDESEDSEEDESEDGSDDELEDKPEDEENENEDNGEEIMNSYDYIYHYQSDGVFSLNIEDYGTFTSFVFDEDNEKYSFVGFWRDEFYGKEVELQVNGEGIIVSDFDVSKDGNFITWQLDKDIFDDVYVLETYDGFREDAEYEQNLYVYGHDGGPKGISERIFYDHLSAGEHLVPESYYINDTLGGGAMGSPIINEENKVVGIYGGSVQIESIERGYAFHIRNVLNNIKGYIYEGDFDFDYSSYDGDDLLTSLESFEKDFLYSVGLLSFDGRIGTGFVFEKTENYIYFLTNQHVVEGFDYGHVYLGPTNHSFDIEVVDYVIDESKGLDIGVVRMEKEGIDTSRVNVFDLNDNYSEMSEEGQEMFYYGFPDGVPSYDFGEYYNPANLEKGFVWDVGPLGGASGSPLISETGEVVGVYYGYGNDGDQQIGFATYSDKALNFIEGLTLD